MRGIGSSVVLVVLAATLALLPFEGLLLRRFDAPSWRFTITDVEAAAAATFLAWLVLLVTQRRLPAIPRSVAIALGLLALLTALSAAAAGVHGPLGAQVATRAALAWGLFLVATDLVCRGRTAAILVAVVLTAATVSAVVGWIAVWNGSADGLFGAGRLFTVGGVPRMSGTWDYPTIAAMAWESVFLVSLPLVALDRRRLAGDRRWLLALALVPVLAVLGSAVLMTLTRGAFLGLVAGLAVILVAAVALRSRRLAAAAACAGLLIAGGAVLLYARSPLPMERFVTESDRALYGADYAVTGSLAAAPGTTLGVDVTLTNTGLATWRPDGDQPWRLAALWLTPDTRAAVGDHQVAALLPGPVPPGASITVHAVIGVPDVAAPLDLAWDMQQGSVAEFSERDVPVAVTRVTIDAAAAGRPAAVTRAQPLLLYPELLPILDRPQLWTAAIRIVERHPLLGVGPGAFRRVYGAELGLTRWDTQIHANDLYLELAATTGLLGLGAFLLAVGLAVGRQARGLGRVSRAPAPTPAVLLLVGSLAATAAALAHGVVDHFLVFTPMAILFWVLLGLGVGLAERLGGGGRRPRTRSGVAG